MAACFNILAITLVNRREMGLLKRLRLSPLPTWMLLAAIFINSMIVALIQVVLMLLVGRFGYNVHGPAGHPGVRVVVVIVGMVCFTPWGSASALWCPTPTPAGPIVSLDVLHSGGALGALVPGRSPARVWRPSPNFFPIRHLITRLVDSFTGIPGTSHTGTTCW